MLKVNKRTMGNQKSSAELKNKTKPIKKKKKRKEKNYTT
jgi:hypothetical protein